MNKFTTRYAQFWAPGLFFGESWTKELCMNETPEWPGNAYAYQLWEREDIDDGETYKGTPRKVGKLIYHPDSTIASIEDIRAARTPIAPGPALLRNMEINKWDKVIWTRWGNWPQPWEPDRMEVASE